MGCCQTMASLWTLVAMSAFLREATNAPILTNLAPKPPPPPPPSRPQHAKRRPNSLCPTNMAPENPSKRNLIFQVPSHRCHVSWREGIFRPGRARTGCAPPKPKPQRWCERWPMTFQAVGSLLKRLGLAVGSLSGAVS